MRVTSEIGPLKRYCSTGPAPSWKIFCPLIWKTCSLMKYRGWKEPGRSTTSSPKP